MVPRVLAFCEYSSEVCGVSAHAWLGQVKHVRMYTLAIIVFYFEVGVSNCTNNHVIGSFQNSKRTCHICE